MAVVAVTADNNRFNDAVSTANWGNITGGGGVAAEGDIVYQGTGSQSRKVSTTKWGRGYDPGSGGVDMTATDRKAWLCKINATNFAALNNRGSTAMIARIGSGASAYYDYFVAGKDNYPARGGWILIAIDPNVAGYRDATSGSPSLTAVDYFGVVATFSSGSKAENLCIDALDVGAGLHLVGGDSTSTDGVFQDFVDADEGTTSGRWGYVSTREGVIYVNGKLTIGQNTSDTQVATVFIDEGKTVVWNNGYFATGYARLLIDMGGTGSEFTLTNCNLIGRGMVDNDLGLGYTTTEDTRPVLDIVDGGNQGDTNFTGCQFLNWSTLIVDNAVLFTDCVLECESIDSTASWPSYDNVTIRTASVANASCLDSYSTNPRGVFGTTIAFVQNGAGHAQELDAGFAETVDYTGITWEGYGADASSSAAIFLNQASGNPLTILVDKGQLPSVRTAGRTFNIIAGRTTVKVFTRTATGASIANVRLFLACDTGGSLPAQASVTISRVTTVATVAHTAHLLRVGDIVLIEGADQAEYNGKQTIVTVPDANSYTFTVSGSPTTPATGTIVSTLVLLDGISNGIDDYVQNFRDFPADQPVTGRASYGAASSPFWKSVDINTTVDETNGLLMTAVMVPDE